MQRFDVTSRSTATVEGPAAKWYRVRFETGPFTGRFVCFHRYFVRGYDAKGIARLAFDVLRGKR